jgi:glycosyltransferase involved in cell wall biosynthesis
LPAIRDRATVGDAITSVLAQELDDFELLVGDETGSAQAVVEAIGDRRVRYFRNAFRLGLAANHMALLNRARGRYVSILHDDDRWEPAFLSSLAGVLDRDPEVGLAYCATSVHRYDGTETVPWPSPLPPGRHDDVLAWLIREEWFLLPSSSLWRHKVWTGAASYWPDLRCADLQFFLSVAAAGWAFFYLDKPLAHFHQHAGQTGSPRGPDHGLAMADDVLTFWGQWLQTRPPADWELSARPRANWYLRRARALMLNGRIRDARADIDRARELGGDDLPDFRRLSLAALLPAPVVHGTVALRRAVQYLKP